MDGGREPNITRFASGGAEGYSRVDFAHTHAVLHLFQLPSVFLPPSVLASHTKRLVRTHIHTHTHWYLCFVRHRQNAFVKQIYKYIPSLGKYSYPIVNQTKI